MKNYGIYGGTFNPPHIAHSITAECICEELMLDRMIFMPSANPPLKKSIPSVHRLALAMLAFGGNDKFDVSDVEFRNPDEKSYTVNTLKILKEDYKGEAVKFHLILGIDKLIELPKWKDPEKLFELSEVIVMNRPGYTRERTNEFFDKVKFIQIPHLEISSTMIRDRVREGKSIRYFVNDDVREYIEENNLYL